MFIQASVSIKFFFLLLTSSPWYGCLTIYPLKDIWVVSSVRLLQLLWICMHKLMCEMSFYFSEIYTPSPMAGLYWKSIFSLRNYQTIFQSVMSLIHSHQQSMNDSLTLQSHQHWVLLLLVIQICSGCGDTPLWFNTQVSKGWWGISFHVLICLFLSSLGKHLILFFVHFLNGSLFLFFSLYWIWKVIYKF